MISKEEFISQYIENSDMTREEYNRDFVALPCNCGDKLCQGWATICNNELSIKTHLKLYS